jgi:hypothetical protein
MGETSALNFFFLGVQLMAQPVWVLSVDLQTKTATFTSGLADAAKGARASFNDIKAGAQEMGRETGYSMMEARHGVMLLGEEFGVHLPRALTSFIASIGPIGSAMSAAFPFLAIVVGATLLLEHLHKLKEAGEKLTESQERFGTTTLDVLNKLDDKLLQAGIRTDELNHNHLAKLNKELELIDHQSMDELVRAFDILSKDADGMFAQLKASWYQFGAGSAGAKHALESFQTQYASLLAQGKDQEASNLLSGTRETAEHVLALQKQIRDNQTSTGTGGTHQGDYSKFEEAKVALQALSVGYTDKEVSAQQILVQALQRQVDVQSRVNELTAKQKGNAKQAEGDKSGGEADKQLREQASQERKELEEMQRLWEQNYREAVSNLQQNEREKIDATKQGSAARLAAIDAAIREEQTKGLQDTGFYRGLLTSRVNEARQMVEEEGRLKAEAGKEGAQHELKMGELEVAAQRDAGQLALSTMRNAYAARTALELKLADESNSVKLRANQQDIAALDKSGKDYENKLKGLQDKQLELVREHENEVTQIKDKAEEARNTRILTAQRGLQDAEAKGLTSTLMRHESFAKMMDSLGQQVAAGMMETALKAILANDMTKISDAKFAARQGWKAGSHFPFPANLVMEPLLAASAFASVMAFEGGGVVPGVGRGDSVPAMLEPGEGVLPKRLMEGLNRSAGGAGGGDTHIHHHSTYHVQALDSDGVDRVLHEHHETFARHFENHVRRLNR